MRILIWDVCVKIIHVVLLCLHVNVLVGHTSAAGGVVGWLGGRGGNGELHGVGAGGGGASLESAPQ